LMKKHAFILCLFAGLMPNSQVQAAGSKDMNRPGGEMTHKRISTRSFIYPGQGVSRKQQLDFWTGFSFFRDPWVIAPSSTKDRDGLGPLFNARSCIACHTAGSRGEMSEPGKSLPTALVIRLGLADDGAKADAMSEHAYGGQIQPRAIRFNQGKLPEKPKGEAWLDLSYQPLTGTYPDGESYELQRPSYRLTDLAYGDMPARIKPSPRLAPNVFGAGLLDAISEEALLAQEDADDSDKDGISAKYNRVMDIRTGEQKPGRFGFKAKHPTLSQQVAAAFRDDIGITSRLFPEESCTPSQQSCLQSAKLSEHTAEEIPDKLLSLVVTFNSLLGVPPMRNQGSERVAKGRSLFNQAGCHQCHTPSYTTASDYADASLANQTIWPYTDLALHDMGSELADGVIEGSANGREWRTAPLWGIGLQQKITGQQRFLHDGRARTIEEAILWHGGEANAAREKFKQLSKEQRQSLIFFVNSI